MSEKSKPNASLAAYITGFILSIGLTLAAYYLVLRHVNSQHVKFSHRFLILFLTYLALVQLAVQLIFFLHLNKESKPRWNFLVFSFAATVVIILVFGSLWIMNNLNYHHGGHASPTQLEQSIIQDEGIEH